MYKKMFSSLFLIFMIVLIWQSFKPVASGLDYQSEPLKISDEDVEFLFDLTGEKTQTQEIFNNIIKYVNEADDYILFDMFLFNSFASKDVEVKRKISSEISFLLVDKINDNPKIKIDFITDNINTVYGGSKNKELDMLKSAGVNVIITDNTKLRDSNTLYSPIWRTVFQWFGNSNRSGLFPHPFSNQEQKVSLRSYLNLLNFKANHRKVFVADYNNRMVSIVTSANPHDGSSNHSNVALKIMGNFWLEIYASENAVAVMSGKKLSEVPKKYIETKTLDVNTEIQLLTENKIKKSLVTSIDKTTVGDSIKIVMFYLSDREVVKSLINAANRRVDVKIILDPNKDAFGYQKGGIPNKQVAFELVNNTREKMSLRWFNTHGEQFHSKMIIIDYAKYQTNIYLGSANLTRRNLENYNLETNILLKVDKEKAVVKKIESYFDRVWFNTTDEYTSDYEKYEDKAFYKKVIYRLQEMTGLCTY